MFKGNMPFNSDYFYKKKCKITNETSQFLLQQHKTLTKKKKLVHPRERNALKKYFKPPNSRNQP